MILINMITLSVTKISPERENVRKNVLHKYLENPCVLQRLIAKQLKTT